MAKAYANFGAALTKAGAPTSGTAQVETATVAGTITGDGNVKAVVTAAGMTNSPKTVLAAVLNGDTAAVVAGKLRTALAADPDVSAFFTVSGTTTAIILTAIASAANDATLNIATDNDTSTGLTTTATSANTTAGVRGDYKGAAKGNIMVDTTNQNLYENTGDYNKPTWALL